MRDIKDLNALDFAEVQQAFNKISFVNTELVALIQGLALLFAIFNIMRVVKDTDGKTIDFAMFIKLFREYALFLVAIIILPVFINGVESILGYVADAYTKSFGEKPKSSIALEEIKEVKGVFNRIINNFSIKDLNPFTIGDKMATQSIDLVMTLIIKPFIVLIDNWSYGFAMVYRFIYLGALKLTGGFALACYLYPPYRKYFETWVKNLIICYLMIPAFLFVVIFVDGVRDQYLLKDNFQTGILIVCLMVKIGGFGMMNKYLQQSL